MLIRICYFILLIPSCTSTYPQNSKLTVHQVIDKHLEAMGGKANLEKIKNAKIIASSLFDNDTVFSHATQAPPNKLRIDFKGKLIDDNSIIHNNGNSYFVKGDSVLSLGKEYSNSHVAEAQSLFQLLNREKYGWNLSFETNDSLLLYNYHVIKCENKELDLTLWRYVNPNTFLIDVTVDQDNIKAYYSNYQDYGGFLYPNQVRFVINDGEESVMTFHSIETNIEIDEGIFEVEK